MAGEIPHLDFAEAGELETLLQNTARRVVEESDMDEFAESASSRTLSAFAYPIIPPHFTPNSSGV